MRFWEYMTWRVSDLGDAGANVRISDGEELERRNDRRSTRRWLGRAATAGNWSACPATPWCSSARSRTTDGCACSSSTRTPAAEMTAAIHRAAEAAAGPGVRGRDGLRHGRATQHRRGTSTRRSACWARWSGCCAGRDDVDAFVFACFSAHAAIDATRELTRKPAAGDRRGRDGARQPGRPPLQHRHHLAALEAAARGRGPKVRLRDAVCLGALVRPGGAGPGGAATRPGRSRRWWPKRAGRSTTTAPRRSCWAAPVWPIWRRGCARRSTSRSSRAWRPG